MQSPIRIATPLAPEDLMFESMSVTSGLSTLGEMRLTLLSPKPDLKAPELLGQPVSVQVLRRDESLRYFNGHVTRFGIDGHNGRHYRYQAVVRPWLWFLTRTADCRIFQNLTVPDIVKQVFADHGMANVEFNLFRSYRQWVYCVQYRESDYNFIARLLEHEGIYWYFEHVEGQHKLRLVDSQSAHDAVPNYKSLPYFPNIEHLPPDTDYVSRWASAMSVQSGKVVLRSYDFERPAMKLEAKAAHERSYRLSDEEVFDYQGDWTQAGDGAQWAEDRIDELQSDYDTMHATTNSHGVTVGRLMHLDRHPREDQNIEYLVTSESIQAQVNAYESGGLSGEYRCDFSVIPGKQQYRAPRRTPKPFVQGPQTAVVVGPAGEEIFTDKYGRVKVQFPWDRLGKSNDQSSCWIRVSHPWAGKNYGAIHIPRIGQEVVVDFLEGDPDQPLITGRVYNAEQMPPWELPANATQSGILTRSSKGGSVANANAIRFEDKKGAEQLWIHAEKNQDIEVENDETHWVGHDRKKTVDHDETVHVKHDRTETVDNDETITVHGYRTETVDKDETISVHKNRSVSVEASETKMVALQRTHTVGINETIAIGAAQEVAIGALQSITVGANQDTTVGRNQTNTVAKNQSESIGQTRTIEVGKDLTTTVAKKESRSVGEERQTTIGKDDKLQVGKKYVLEAADEITLKTGEASIVMKKDGTIEIKGKDITITGSGKIGVKASGDMVLKGSKIAEN
jgi:type VI secretion system secreted protein VgrG